jgi:twinkle protein
LQDENQKPGKFDAKGSGSITDQVDNVLSVWRNKRKERAREADDMTDDLRKEADCVLICDKQRNGEWEGKLGFWFHQPAMQYLEWGNIMDARRYFD